MSEQQRLYDEIVARRKAGDVRLAELMTRALFGPLAGDDEPETPLRTHKTAPVSDLGPESGQGDRRDDEGRSGAREEGK